MSRFRQRLSLAASAAAALALAALLTVPGAVASARLPPPGAPDVLVRPAPDGALVRIPDAQAADCEIRRPLPERVVLVVRGVDLSSRALKERSQWVRSVRVLGQDMTGQAESQVVIELASSALDARVEQDGDDVVLVLSGLVAGDAPAGVDAEAEAADERQQARDERRAETRARLEAEEAAREAEREARRAGRRERSSTRGATDAEAGEERDRLEPARDLLDGTGEVRDRTGEVRDRTGEVRDRRSHRGPTDEPAADDAAPPTPRSALRASVRETETQTPVAERDGMVRVPAGSFVMGSVSGESYADESPQRLVDLSEFFIDAREVTVGEFARSPLRVPDQPTPGSDLPVVNVTWHEAAEYCDWAGKRLPTEAEWEKAARGSDGRRFPWGGGWGGQRANSGVAGDGFDELSPPGAFPAGASPHGALDMAGNAWEWVGDWYSRDAYLTVHRVAPRGPSRGSHKVTRGGSWRGEYSINVRTAVRLPLAPSERRDDVGFRCALSR